jgi:hypothetical protein
MGSGKPAGIAKPLLRAKRDVTRSGCCGAWLEALFVLLAAAALVACSGSSTLERDDDDGAGGASASAVTTASATGSGAGGQGDGVLGSGAYVLAVSLVLEPHMPLLFDAAIEVSGAQLSMTLQPLDAMDRMTPVGDPQGAGPVPLGASGLYEASFLGWAIPGEANPISGQPIVVDALLEASEPDCGAVSGQLTSPFRFDLQGSTFALTPADSPDAHALPRIDCRGNHADPL